MAEVCISGILHFLLLYVIFSTCLALTLGAARFTASPPTNIVSSNTTIRLNWVYVVDDKDGEFKDNSPIWEYKGVGSRWLKIAFEDGLDGWKWKLSSECPPKFKNPVRVGKESVATLVIVNTTTDDSGLYRCTLDMALGGPIYSDEVQLTITASTTPSPTTPPTPVQTTVSPTTTATTATESTTTTTSAPPADVRGLSEGEIAGISGGLGALLLAVCSVFGICYCCKKGMCEFCGCEIYWCKCCCCECCWCKSCMCVPFLCPKRKDEEDNKTDDN